MSKRCTLKCYSRLLFLDASSEVFRCQSFAIVQTFNRFTDVKKERYFKSPLMVLSNANRFSWTAVKSFFTLKVYWLIKQHLCSSFCFEFLLYLRFRVGSNYQPELLQRVRVLKDENNRWIKSYHYLIYLCLKVILTHTFILRTEATTLDREAVVVVVDESFYQNRSGEKGESVSFLFINLPMSYIWPVEA